MPSKKKTWKKKPPTLVGDFGITDKVHLFGIHQTGLAIPEHDQCPFGPLLLDVLDRTAVSQPVVDVLDGDDWNTTSIGLSYIHLQQTDNQTELTFVEKHPHRVLVAHGHLAPGGKDERIVRVECPLRRNLRCLHGHRQRSEANINALDLTHCVRFSCDRFAADGRRFSDRFEETSDLLIRCAHGNVVDDD